MQLTISGGRFLADGPIKKALGGGDDFSTKMLSSCACGASASLLGCPTDVIKVRLQCDSGRVDPATGKFVTGLYTGQLRKYRNSTHAVSLIWRGEGVRGFCERAFPRDSL